MEDLEEKAPDKGALELEIRDIRDVLESPCSSLKGAEDQLEDPFPMMFSGIFSRTTRTISPGGGIKTADLKPCNGLHIVNDTRPRNDRSIPGLYETVKKSGGLYGLGEIQPTGEKSVENATVRDNNNTEQNPDCDGKPCMDGAQPKKDVILTPHMVVKGPGKLHSLEKVPSAWKNPVPSGKNNNGSGQSYMNKTVRDSEICEKPKIRRKPQRRSKQRESGVKECHDSAFDSDHWFV